tara:strand:+ start:642 stop:1151 length:510 start_codon:yes stop_codon:yes gene_type:complete
MTSLRLAFIKLDPDAQLPNQQDNAAGMDLYASKDCTLNPCSTTLVDTGIALAHNPELIKDRATGASTVFGPAITPERQSCFIKIEGRSGLACKGVFPIGGIIDPTYRGEIKAILFNSRALPHLICKGDRIAQLVVYPAAIGPWTQIQLEEVTEGSETERGDKGFGSSGK